MLINQKIKKLIVVLGILTMSASCTRQTVVAPLLSPTSTPQSSLYNYSHKLLIGPQIISGSRDNRYNALKKKIDLVIVDEGHREPAPEWARAIRTVNKPTILFTATPYRNDHKLFAVDRDNVFPFSHGEAETSNFIRHVAFKNIQFERTRKGFVSALLDFYKSEFTSIKPTTDDEPRVIVRCETSDEVNEITQLIREKGYSAIGVHETFRNRGGEEYLKNRCPIQKIAKVTSYSGFIKIN